VAANNYQNSVFVWTSVVFGEGVHGGCESFLSWKLGRKGGWGGMYWFGLIGMEGGWVLGVWWEDVDGKADMFVLYMFRKCGVEGSEMGLSS